MTNEQLTMEQPAPSERQGISTPLLIAIILLAPLLTLLGYRLGANSVAAPAESSAEVGFARDMMIHHAQAVDMAVLLRDRTEDPEMKQLALDILLTQQAQIGQMQGWLMAWERPIARVGPAMEWMGMPTTGPMPGMASPEQLNQLRELEGEAADELFLHLMIPHHVSGVDMGEAALELATRPEVRALAQSIVDAQVSEIAYMETLLQQKGLQPVPEAVKESGSHSNH
jgi:uncharacterized protein (DUF305 family)